LLTADYERLLYELTWLSVRQ